MHHVHLNAGQAIGAADYQAHLERMKQLARLREEEAVSKRTRDQAFVHLIDADEESAGDQEPATSDDPAGFSDGETEAGGGDEPTNGTRYA